MASPTPSARVPASSSSRDESSATSTGEVVGDGVVPLSVLMPAYNEEEAIALAVDEVQRLILGRFVAWKYEVSNQDHSLMQGVEVVNHLLRGGAERTCHGQMAGAE